jgi:type II secretory pathway predicted ATPase ExeA
MYTEHFELTNKPFNLVPDPSLLYLSPGHKKALTLLQYGLVSHSGFTVVTGEIGAGKTTLIRSLLKDVEEDCVIGLINNTHESFGDLMVWVLDALEIDSQAIDNAGRYRDYVDFVVEKHAQGKRVILIVDEAQNLSLTALEELRLLSNVNIDSEIFLQLVLAGQPQLIDKLNQPELEQFAQRIGVEFHLKALDFAQTQKYIEHRLKVSGAKRKIFTFKACAIIYCLAEGIPRKIYNLCDMSLVYAFSDDKKTVQVKTVLEMISEKKSFSVIKTAESLNSEVIKVKSWLAEKYQITF